MICKGSNEFVYGGDVLAVDEVKDYMSWGTVKGL
jgi:hypothetical protein